MKLMKQRQFFVGLVLIFVLSAMGLMANFISSHDPNQIQLKNKLISPTWQHLMGTDQNGRDIFSQILHGARVSLVVAFSVVTISLLIGLILGCLSGFIGGWIDSLIMRSVDVVFAFPGFLLVLSLAAISQGQSLLNLIIILSATGWAGYTRLVRGEVLHLKHKEYVVSAQALGAGSVRQVVHHLIPNLWPPLIVHASFSMAMTIITEGSLSFLGVGVPPHIPTWGTLLNSGRHYLLEAPHISLFPGLALLITVMAFNLMGEGLQKSLSPRQRG
jgi:peptide/nickel transport system permease protein